MESYLHDGHDLVGTSYPRSVSRFGDAVGMSVRDVSEFESERSPGAEKDDSD